MQKGKERRSFAERQEREKLCRKAGKGETLQKGKERRSFPERQGREKLCRKTRKGEAFLYLTTLPVASTS